MTGLGTFLRFEVLRLLRNVRYVGITVGFPVVFYILFLNDEHPAAQIDGTPGARTSWSRWPASAPWWRP